MDFKQLRSFVAVADCGSFTQAAAKLYASQPTVSAHIRQLEEELHETLFLRTTKSLAITPRGRELYDYAVHVLDLQEQLMRAWAQDERTIRLGASTIPSSCILPEASATAMSMVDSSLENTLTKVAFFSTRSAGSRPAAAAMIRCFFSSFRLIFPA